MEWWAKFLAIACLAPSLIAVMLAWGTRRLFHELTGWLIVPVVALLVGYASLHVGMAWAQFEVEANPANADADGPLMFVAVMLGAMLVAVCATVSACIAGALTLRRMRRKK